MSKHAPAQDRRYVLVQQLAPLSPPCFGSRLEWVMYLVSADEANDPKLPSPIVRSEGGATFDHRFNFCADCSECWRREQRVVERGVCQPQWLLKFIPIKEVA